jgi:multiple sugar transport system permease protein
VSLVVGRLAVFRTLGVTGTPVPLIAPALLATSPAFVLLYAWSFRRLASGVYDSAAEIGMGTLATWRWTMPRVRGVTAATIGLSFLLTWGNVLDPLFYVSSERWFTVPLALRSLAALPVTDQPLMLAGAVLASAPAVIVIAWILARSRDLGLRRSA